MSRSGGLKAGDEVSLRAVVREVRPDGVVILTIPASTSIIPAVVLSSTQLLGEATAPAPATSNPLSVGAHVRSRKRERGRVIAPVSGIYKVRRLEGRTDAIMVQWDGRSLPTWEAPEDVFLESV